MAEYLDPPNLPNVLREIQEMHKVSGEKVRQLWDTAWKSATARHDQYLKDRTPPLAVHRAELITIFTVAGVWHETAEHLVDNHILNYV